MIAIALVLGITSFFLTYFLVHEIRKNKKMEKENDGLRHLALHRETNLNTLIESGLPTETIANILAHRIQFMIESNASIKSVLDLCDELFITNQVVIPVGAQSNIDKVRAKIQQIVSERFDREKLQDWVNSSKLNEKQLKRIDASFFRSITKSMIVWSPLDN